MTGTFTHPSGPVPRRAGTPRTTWPMRAFVLGPLGLAAIATAAAFALDADTGLVGPLWMAAIAWTVPASLAGALWRGVRHRDWSAFGRHELPENDEGLDMDTRTGSYAYLRDREDEQLRDDDHLR